MVITDLAVLAYARGFTHWLYSEPVALASALRPGFFSRAAGMFTTGDLITIRAPSGTAVRAIHSIPDRFDERGQFVPGFVELVRTV